jgi:hypothetical protein
VRLRWFLGLTVEAVGWSNPLAVSGEVESGCRVGEEECGCSVGEEECACRRGVRVEKRSAGVV